MKIGIPKEIKNHEYRVGLAPAGVAELTHAGHTVFVETGAGLGIGEPDAAYQRVGATILPDAAAVFAQAEMVVKVKEPQAVERALLRPGQLLFTFLHLAPDPAQTQELLASGATCIAYETVTDAAGGLPLLRPMSQVAGRLSIQAGATALEKEHGGRGVLLGGVPGVEPGKVVIIGGGVVGFHAAQMAVGLQADVTILDRSPAVLDRLANHFENRAKVLYSSRDVLREAVESADLVVGAVLAPGAATPKLVTREMVARMLPGAVVVDVAIDQGGCFETSRPTTHADPTYVVDDVVHYCVANIPGAVARTSTHALNLVTMPFVLALANKGWRQALRDDPHLRAGLNIHDGHTTCQPVAQAQGLEYVTPESLLG